MGPDPSYREIFGHRGDLYHQAMVRFPDARRQEFRQLLDLSEIEQGHIVVDVPAGGGYLRRYVKGDVRVLSLETSEAFAQCCHAGGVPETVFCDLHSLPIADRQVDRVLSLAGLHHLENKPRLFAEALRILKPGGVFCVGDVDASSRVARFLDEFIGRHNVTGHQGRYIGPGTRHDLEAVGFAVSRQVLARYIWAFERRGDLYAFVRGLFGVILEDDDDLLAGINEYLGLRRTPDGYALPWELRFFQCRRPS